MARILIVENSTFMKGALSSLLEYGGHVVVGTAENGIKALELFKKYKPDIVTCDILMGGIDGLPIIKSILKEDNRTKILAVSIFGQELKIKEAFNTGVRGVIYKPYKHSEIMEEIHKILKS